MMFRACFVVRDCSIAAGGDCEVGCSVDECYIWLPIGCRG